MGLKIGLKRCIIMRQNEVEVRLYCATFYSNGCINASFYSRMDGIYEDYVRSCVGSHKTV